MGSIVRSVWRTDRSYVFASFAFAVAFIASVYLTFAEIFTDEFADGSSSSFNGIEWFGTEFILLLLLPVLTMAAPLLVLSRTKEDIRRNQRINSVVSTLVIGGFVVFLFAPVGVYYFPAFIFSIASSISLFFGLDRKSSGAPPLPDVRTSGRSAKARRSERRGRTTGVGGGRRRRRDR